MQGQRIPIAINVMTLFDQTDRALTLSANQFAGRSLVLDRFVNDILYLPLLNGGVFLAAFWWLWFEANESGACVQRRNVVAALLGTTAERLYRSLAEQGDASAQHFLGKMYESGEGIRQDPVEAAKWFRLRA